MANDEYVSALPTFGLVIVQVLSAGCSSEATVDNAEWRGLPRVTGTVTLDGTPLADATVSFESAENTSRVATTGALGKFTLNIEESGESVIGKYAVRIHTTAEGDFFKGDGVPARYNEKTELVVDILDGKNDFNFRLDSTHDLDAIGD